jgi:hypothetical protein
MNCPICKTSSTRFAGDFQHHVTDCFKRFETAVTEDEREDEDTIARLRTRNEQLEAALVEQTALLTWTSEGNHFNHHTGTFRNCEINTCKQVRANLAARLLADEQPTEERNTG